MDSRLKDVWIPLEGVSSGELRLKIKVVKVDDPEGSMVCLFNRNLVILIVQVWQKHNFEK